MLMNWPCQVVLPGLAGLSMYREHADDLVTTRRVQGCGSPECFDNAQAESFNATLKVERVNRTAYPTREQARKDVTRYIELRYNTKLLPLSVGLPNPHGRLIPITRISGERPNNTNRSIRKTQGGPDHTTEPTRAALTVRRQNNPSARSN
jgi:putative transposase